jgi:hypothetical protein
VLVIIRNSYCLSAWGGFFNSDQVGQVNALLEHAKKYHLTDSSLYNICDFDELLMQADCERFKDIQCEHHSPHHRLQCIKTDCHALRKRRHNFVLPL